MKYTVSKSLVSVIGKLWMPNATAATSITASSYDVENMRDDEGVIDRDSVEQWLMSHSGDFSRVLDFAASIEDPTSGETITIDWADEDSEFTYSDCMFPSDDDQ